MTGTRDSLLANIGEIINKVLCIFWRKLDHPFWRKLYHIAIFARSKGLGRENDLGLYAQFLGA